MSAYVSRAPLLTGAIGAKDQLLQESGYFVLRFLAEDAGKELDTVLDAIVRSSAHGQRRVKGFSLTGGGLHDQR